MGIQITARQDYSMLFSSLNNSATSRNTNSAWGIGVNFSDYASIKNGSYGKLLKAYYKQDRVENEETSVSANRSSLYKTKVDAQVKKELGDVQNYAKEVKDSAQVLLEKGSKSVFKDEDKSKVYDAVSAFAEDYNTLIEKGRVSSSVSVERYTNSMAYTMEGHRKELSELGITVGADHKLSVNKDTFMAADLEKVKSVFNDRGSLSELISDRASAVEHTANSESHKNVLYRANGMYSSINSAAFLNTIV